MHIPDNYLSPSTCAVMTAAAIPAWVHSIKKLKAEMPKDKMVMFGIGAAFSFLGMMFNIPMPGGTTGHAVGGTLIALLLGPEAACIAVTIALLVQALLFGDGGILAFGANCFNMAFVLPYVGYYSYRMFCRMFKADELNAGNKKKIVSAGLASYLGINAAALMAAIEFGIQPLLFTNAAGQPLYCPYGLSVSIPAMMLGHLTIFGLAEVIFTVAIYSFLAAGSSNSFYGEENFSKTSSTGFGSKKAGILLAVLMLATPLGLLAAGTAWGEWDIAEIPTMTEQFSWNSLMPDYTLGNLPEWAAYILSAVVGVSILVIAFRLIGAAMKSKINYD
ncbi:MAG: cobalt transporter CbiM [Mogibacterium sp.]|nr:cobalt transporter CbiM [Mogibacterium sp.]